MTINVILSELSGGHEPWIGSSSVHIFILPVKCWSGRSWAVGVLVVDSFEFCSIYFLSVFELES